MIDKHAKANKKLTGNALRNGNPESPGLPPVDVGWADTREEAGLAPPPPPVPPGIRKILRPPPTRKDKGKSRLFGDALQLDRQLSQDDWMKVYEAYQRVGTPAGLARDTGLSERAVRHLLKHGVERLALAPIKEHAVDLAEVNTRMQDMGGDPGSNKSVDNFKFNLPEVQEAVVDRVATEAAGAQMLLKSGMNAASLYNAFLTEVCRIALDKDGGFSLPEKVGPKLIQQLVGTADKLATTLDRAVRLSRLTAGEPESNVSMEVGILIARLDEDAMRRFGETGQIPPELRGRMSPGQVIEADSVPMQKVQGADDE